MTSTPISVMLQQALEIHRQGAVTQAAARYTDILHIDPTNADAHYYLALIACQQGRFSDGNELARKALATNPHHARAHNLLGRTLSALGRPEEALLSFNRAIELAPDLAETYGNRGGVLSDLGRFSEAVDSHDQALALMPNSVADWFNRGLALRAVGRQEDAIASFDRAIAIKPDFAEAHEQRASVFVDLKRLDQVITSCNRILALQPNRIGALIINAKAHCDIGRHKEAVTICDAALAISDKCVEALVIRSVALGMMNLAQESLASLDSALAIKPDCTDALINKGCTLNLLKEYARASQIFGQVLTQDPQNTSALFNRGVSYLELRKSREALACFDQALANGFENADVQYNRGLALVQLQRLGEAIASFERAMALLPTHSSVFAELAKAYLTVCNWSALGNMLVNLAEHVGASQIDPFFLVGIDSTPAQQLTCAKKWLDELIGIRPERFPPRAFDRLDKIRIAYVSADFRHHPTSYLLVDLIERHDRNRFEVIGISFGPDDGSAIRSRMVKAFDQFHDVSNGNDQSIAQLLYDSKVHIAVDLMGYTQFARPGVFAYRPAPIQVNFLGYPSTTGADFIDYIIGDSIVLPFDQQPYFSEKIVQLPDSYQPNDSQRRIVPQGHLHSEVGLPDNGVVFCCFNSVYKIAAPIFDVWMRLLHKVDGSVLWLLQSNELAAANLRNAARLRQVDPSRILFAPPMPHVEHLARYAQADLFLDTLPYNAHTTASDALWAGLPLLTCKGTTFAGRVAASLLNALDLRELITTSLEEYEALALELVQDPSRLTQLKAKLSRNRETHPLFDTDRFARNIEEAYVTMWEAHQRGQPPKSFPIKACDR